MVKENEFRFFCKPLIIKMLEGWEIRQPVYLHRIWDTLIGYAINQWRIDFSHSVKIYLHFRMHGRKMQSFRKYFSRQLPPLGKVIRVDSIKIANEVRAHAGTRY